MERNVNFAYIGGLFLLAVIAMAGFVIWLGGGQLDSSKYHAYVAYSPEGISGVGEGTSIRYKGILVGKVKKIGFKDQNSDLIRIDLLIDSHIKLLKNTCISAESQGIAGGTFLDITQGSGEELHVGDELCYQKGFMGKLLDNIEKSGGDAQAILAEIKEVLGNENGKNLKEIVVAVKMMLKNLEYTRQNIDALSITAATALKNLDVSLQRGDYNLRQIIAPTLIGIEGSLSEFNRFFSKANLLLDRLEKSPYEAIFGQREQHKEK